MALSQGDGNVRQALFTARLRPGAVLRAPRISGARSSTCVSLDGLRRDRNLQHAIALVGKQVVGRHDVVELVLVRDQHAQIHPF